MKNKMNQYFFLCSAWCAYLFAFPAVMGKIIVWFAVGLAASFVAWKRRTPKAISFWVPGIAVCSVFSFFFVMRWQPSSVVSLIASAFHLSPKFFLCLISLPLIMIGSASVNECIEIVIAKMSSLEEPFSDWIRSNKQYLYPTLILFSVFLVGNIPLFIANVPYLDDNERIFWGAPSFGYFGRWLSEWLCYVLHADSYILDISPIPQILACFIMAAACVAAIRVITDSPKVRYYHILSVIPIGLSPLFLECYSYKFDAPYMALSVFFSVFPLLFRKKSAVKYCAVVLLSALAICMTYQMSSGLFPMLVALLFFWECVESGGVCKDRLIWLLHSAGSYLAGLILFKVAILDQQSYELSYQDMTMFSLKSMPLGILGNMIKYFAILFWYSKPEWMIAVLIIVSIYMFAIWVDSIKHKKTVLLLSGLVLVVCFALSYGVNILLEKAPFHRPRYIYGSTCMLGILMIKTGEILHTKKQKITHMNEIRGLFSLLSVALCWSMITFSLSYGNALGVQREYDEFRRTMVAESLSAVEGIMDREQINVKIQGSIGYAPSIEKLPSQYRLLKVLVPVGFEGENYWGYYYFLYNYGFHNLVLADDYEMNRDQMNLHEKNAYFILWEKDNNVLIELPLEPMRFFPDIVYALYG